MGKPRLGPTTQSRKNSKMIFEFLESVHTCSLMTSGKQNMKIAWLVQGRKMFILFPRMQAGDRK